MCQDQGAFQETEAGPEATPERKDPGPGLGGADHGPGAGQEGGQGQGQDPEEEGATDHAAGAGAGHTGETGLQMDTDYMLEVSSKITDAIVRNEYLIVSGLAIGLLELAN